MELRVRSTVSLILERLCVSREPYSVQRFRESIRGDRFSIQVSEFKLSGRHLFFDKMKSCVYVSGTGADAVVDRQINISRVVGV